MVFSGNASNLDYIIVVMSFHFLQTLKSHDYINVEQVSPYSEIIISARPQLEALIKNR